MTSKRFFLGQKNNVDGSLATAVKCLSAKKERLGVSLWSDGSSLLDTSRFSQSVPRHRFPPIASPSFSDEEEVAAKENKENMFKSPVALFRPLRFSSPHEADAEAARRAKVIASAEAEANRSAKEETEESTEADKSTEADAEADRSTETDTEADRSTETDVEADRSAGTEADRITDAEADKSTETDRSTEADRSTETDSEADRSAGAEANRRTDAEADRSTETDAEANRGTEAEASFPVALFRPLEESLRSSAKARRQLWESSEEDSAFERFLTRARPKEEEEKEKDDEEEGATGMSDFIVPDDEVESSECVDSGSDEEEEEGVEVEEDEEGVEVEEEDEEEEEDEDEEEVEEDEEEEEKELSPSPEKKPHKRERVCLPRRALADIFSSEEEETEAKSEETEKPPRAPEGPPRPGARRAAPSGKKWRQEVDPEADPAGFLLSLTEREGGHEAATKFVRHFKKHREELTAALFRIFNEHVFNNKLPPEPQLTVEWNARLTKTAGHCKQFHNRATKVRSSKVRLSTKVCSSAERVRDTLLHELCHAATWLIDNDMRAGHGPLWKAWARRATRRFPDMPPVTTTHSYVIFTKFTYRCTGCGAHVNRHSRSVDTDKMVCSLCRSKFELVINTPGRTPRGPNRFAEFVRANYSEAKRAGTSHGEAMRELSRRFAALKTAATADKENSF